jgi:hypothetical protein
VHALDQRAERVTDRVAKAAIEVRARTVQIQTIVKTFLLPGLVTRQARLTEGKRALEFKSPGYRKLMEEVGEGYAHAAAATQLKNVPTR